MKHLFISFICAVIAGACAGDSAPGITPLTPGGVSDIGQFRAEVAEGRIPSPDLLDEAGFFAEHSIGAPAAICDEAVCVEASLGVQGNMINGNNCTLVRVALSSNRTANVLDQRQLIVVVDRSDATVDSWSLIRDGILSLGRGLLAGDRLTLVSYADDVSVDAQDLVMGDIGALDIALGNLKSGGNANLYAALQKAYGLAEASALEEARVVLVTGGVADLGITSPARISALIDGQADLGVATTVVGTGEVPNAELLAKIGATGAGNVYFMADLADAREIFLEEVATSLVPIARNVTIRFDGGPSYDVRAAYGAKDVFSDGESGLIALPSLFLATRKDGGGQSMGEGRRGGNGALLFELTPNGLSQSADAFLMGDVTVDYVNAEDGLLKSIQKRVDSTYRPGEFPEAGLFTDPDIEKAFVALNIFVGLRMMTTSVREGDYSEALAVGRQLEVNIKSFLERRDDSDVRSDLELLQSLLALVEVEADNATQGIPPVMWND